MPAATLRSTLKKLIKADYGFWLLVHLPSGRWAAMWSACLDNDSMCESILTEDPEWFHEEPLFKGHRPNPSYATKEEALREIVSSIQSELDRHPRQEVLIPYLRRARLALIRAEQK
jgi:hypothetical protein